MTLSPILLALDADTIALEFGVFIADRARAYRVSQTAIIAALRPHIAPSQPEPASLRTAADTPAAPPASETTDREGGTPPSPLPSVVPDKPPAASAPAAPLRITNRQRVRECHEANPDWTATQIAEALGMGPQQVRVITSQIGIKLPKDARPPNPNLNAQVIAAYEQHPDWTNRQIADLVGCSYSTVSVWLSTRRKAAQVKQTDPVEPVQTPPARPVPASPSVSSSISPEPRKPATPGQRFYVRDRDLRFVHGSLSPSPTDSGPLMTSNRHEAWYPTMKQFLNVLERWPEIGSMRKEAVAK